MDEHLETRHSSLVYRLYTIGKQKHNLSIDHESKPTASNLLSVTVGAKELKR